MSKMLVLLIPLISGTPLYINVKIIIAIKKMIYQQKTIYRKEKNIISDIICTANQRYFGNIWGYIRGYRR